MRWDKVDFVVSRQTKPTSGPCVRRDLFEFDAHRAPGFLNDGSIVSAKRTAASMAALAATLIQSRQTPKYIGVIGAGRKNHEVIRFLLYESSSVKMVKLCDIESP